MRRPRQEWLDPRTALPWLDRGDPYFVNASRTGELVSGLERLGFTVHQIDGAGVADDRSLLTKLAEALSFPDYFGHNWEAYHDCLGDFAEPRKSPSALIWLRAHDLLMSNPRDFVRSAHFLMNDARDLGLADPPFQMEVFFVGEGSGFR